MNAPAPLKRLGRAVVATLQAIRLYLLLSGLGLGSLGWNLLTLLLYPLLPKARGQRVGRAGIARGYQLFWFVAQAIGVMRIDTRCMQALQDQPRLIVVANHPTMLDALLLAARLPRSVCIMKAALMKNIFLGAGARLARYIRNDSARSMVRLAVEDLRAGAQLIIFPEGTRTETPPVNRFTPGVTLIAKLSGAPIQTVFVDTQSPYLSKGWPIWRVPPIPMVFTLRLGQRFEPQADSQALTAELEQYFRAALAPPPSSAACPSPPAPTSS